MARKSRRNKNVEAVSNQIIENCENLIDTGAYIRLSVENGGNETDETLVHRGASGFKIGRYIYRQWI